MLVKKVAEKISSEGQCILTISHRAVIVDADDYDRLSLYHWRIRKSGCCFYVARGIHKGKKICWQKMHREIVHCPADLEVHHINRNTLDNRKLNLKIVTRAQHSIIHAEGT